MRVLSSSIGAATKQTNLPCDTEVYTPRPLTENEMRKRVLLTLLALIPLLSACPKKGGGYLGPTPVPNASAKAR